MDLLKAMAQIKKKCEETAIKMAKIELSIWDDAHKKGLKESFGFTDKTLKKRKQQLTKTAKKQIK